MKTTTRKFSYIVSIFIFYLFFTPVFIFAQEETGGTSTTTAYLFLAGLLFTLAILFASFMVFEAFERKPKKEIVKEKVVLEQSNIIPNHIYDGIQELDNRPPAWFQLLFYGTIVFAIVYMINFHVLKKSNSSVDEYIEEMTFAQQQKDEIIKSGALINENTVTQLTDPADIAKGKEIFIANCVTCHGNNGEGTVGPNLTDDFWIHGGGIKNVFATISNGVPAKGMITWKNQMNPKQIQFVASYVLSLKGTNPPNGKAPEGTIWKDTVSTNTSESKPDSTKNK